MVGNPSCDSLWHFTSKVIQADSVWSCNLLYQAVVFQDSWKLNLTSTRILYLAKLILKGRDDGFFEDRKSP